MIDTTTPKGRLVEAAMRLAREKPWRDITLLDIAEAAGMSLAELRSQVASKAGVLRAFSRAIDDEVLRKAARRATGQAPRDALFEVLMHRLDALEPYKPALKSIIGAAEPDPAMLRTVLMSQHWMLQAAGIDTAGPRGAVKTLGLASLYASVVRTWLDDDDPGLARTMAALDRRLRRGEQNIQALDGLCGIAGRVAGIFRRQRPSFRDASASSAPPRRAEPPLPPAGPEPTPQI